MTLTLWIFKIWYRAIAVQISAGTIALYSLDRPWEACCSVKMCHRLITSSKPQASLAATLRAATASNQASLTPLRPISRLLNQRLWWATQTRSSKRAIQCQAQCTRRNRANEQSSTLMTIVTSITQDGNSIISMSARTGPRPKSLLRLKTRSTSWRGGRRSFLTSNLPNLRKWIALKTWGRVDTM